MRLPESISFADRICRTDQFGLRLVDRALRIFGAHVSGEGHALFGRAALILMAWLLYYNAARSLGLAELTTIYFAAPIVVVSLSVVILHEAVTPMRWIC